MGKREVHICDVCKRDLPFDNSGFPSFRAASVQIQLYANMWGNPEYLAGWKGELCDECVAAIIIPAVEAFHRAMNQRQVNAQPGERVSSPEAEVRPRGRVIEKKQRRPKQ